MCTSRKYPYSPHRGDWHFLGGGGFCKIQKFKEVSKALLEFPRGVGGLRKNTFCARGGMDIFWNYTIFLSQSQTIVKPKRQQTNCLITFKTQLKTILRFIPKQLDIYNFDLDFYA